jgi:nitric oxide reductase NorQ protein
VGPQGTGKTQAVRRLAELVHAPLFSTNFSLRTREHHFLGRLDPQPDGTVVFKKGVLPLSMEEGGIYYIDEVNTAEPDSLLRLDEALDDRHEVNIEGFCVKAKPDWYCIASINPLDHAGTKELPPQIISRFPARFMFTYPDLDNELEIVRAHVPNLKGTTLSGMRSLVEAIQQLRVQSLPYTPSLRESIALGKLMASGASQKNAVSWTLVNVYFQYGQSVVDKVKELLTSRGIEVA